MDERLGYVERGDGKGGKGIEEGRKRERTRKMRERLRYVGRGGGVEVGREVDRDN